MKGRVIRTEGAGSKLLSLFISLQRTAEPKPTGFVSSTPCGARQTRADPPMAIQPDSEIPELWGLQCVQRRFIKALHGVAVIAAAG